MKLVPAPVTATATPGIRRITTKSSQAATTARRLATATAVVATVAVCWWLGLFSAIPLSLAQTSLANRELEAAAKWLKLAGYLGPVTGECHFLNARLARLEGEPEMFATEIDLAAQGGIPRERLQREEGLVLLTAGRLEEVEDRVGQWLASPDQREVCEAYANGLASRAEFEKLELILDAWARDYPRDPQPNYRRGRLREHQRRLEDAESEYRSALERKADYYPAAYALGRLLLDRKENEAALGYFQQCLAMKPDSAAKVGLALCYKAKGDIEEARRLLTSAANDPPEERTKSYQLVGEANAQYKAAIELGKLESERGNFEAAIGWLEQPVSAEPRDMNARYAYAIALRGGGQKEQADREFAAVADLREKVDRAGKLLDQLTKTPEEVEARYELGKLLLECDKDATGLYWLKSVLAIEPLHRPTHQALADYYAAHSADSPLNERLARYHRNRAGAAKPIR